MKLVRSTHTPYSGVALPLAAAVATLLVLAATSAQADWPNTNATKWVQYPDPTITGYDVLAAQPAAGTQPLIVADDFLCRKTGPITDIHIWASWLGDQPDPTTPITLGIWSDVPAVTNAAGVTPSHPGSMLWSQTFGYGQYAFKAWKSADEQFWNPDPAPAGVILGPDHLIWQYNFYPTNPFVQQGSATAPAVYWLSVSAGANIKMFGWKTATNHWNDDAVYGHLDPAGGQLVGAWQELRDPKNPTGRSLDMAFALTTTPIPPNPPPPPTNKWVQFPDQFNGLDIKAVSPNIVADDFLCTAAGSITNIQVWASWQDDAAPNQNLSFVLSIWTDVPGGSANLASHPGLLVWSETFVPGSYSSTFYTNGTEQFYDPTTGQLAPETLIWLYNFNPRKPFCQQGSTNKPVVYWLSVTTLNPFTGPAFGWKTSTNKWGDDAVYGHVTATGTALGDWKELFDPRSTPGISLNLAFLLNNGPPGPDCDPTQRPKLVQWPDPSTNGLDVLATAPKVLGDDFLCRVPGPINGVRIWGSWLNDKVDPNVTFQLRLWSDVPAIPGTTNYSHPGTLLCTSIFYPPTTVGTSVLRYNTKLFAENLQETFYDPDLPGTSGFIGNDTQIWQYDFYPRLACWKQSGLPTRSQVYWLSLSAITNGGGQSLFGWKTSTNHWNDDAVFGHLNANYLPLGDWVDLHDPRTGKSLDLSLALRNFPIVGINKDLKNLTTATADGIQIIVQGIHEIPFHYDDAPAWPLFQASYVGGNTLLQWSGKTVAPNAITHVGFEIGGSSLTILTMNWLQGTTVVGTPIQVNHHTWGNGTTLTLNNNFVPGAVMPLGNGTVEFYADPVPLDQMNPGTTRNPIVSLPLTVPTEPILPGGAARIPLPTAPPGARYAMFMLNLADSQGRQATMDFVQLPLDAALQPVVDSVGIMGNGIGIGWPSIPGRTYRVQATSDLRSSFFDVFTEIMGTGDELNVMVPPGGSQNFYRVVLDPE